MFLDSTGCVYDYIEIFDGKRTDDPNLGRYCGGNMPAPIRSSSNELLVKFISDQSIAHSGFAASYAAESTGEYSFVIKRGLELRNTVNSLLTDTSIRRTPL